MELMEAKKIKEAFSDPHNHCGISQIPCDIVVSSMCLEGVAAQFVSKLLEITSCGSSTSGGI